MLPFELSEDERRDVSLSASLMTSSTESDGVAGLEDILKHSQFKINCLFMIITLKSNAIKGTNNQQTTNRKQ